MIWKKKLFAKEQQLTEHAIMAAAHAATNLTQQRQRELINQQCGAPCLDRKATSTVHPLMARPLDTKQKTSQSNCYRLN